MRLPFLFLLILSARILYAQIPDKTSWGTVPPEIIKLNDKYINEDVVILLDETKISLYGQQNVYNKHLRIKYLTSFGIEKHKTISLPETTDPLVDYLPVKYDKRATTHEPRAEFDAIKFFEARIIRPNRSIKKADISKSSDIRNEFNVLKIRSYYALYYTISNLVPGDELEIYYTYFPPLEEHYNNYFYSKRIFFNGNLPKQHFKLQLKYESTEKLVMECLNGALPYDTIKTEGKPYKTEFFWEKNNLPGCINEVGSRIYDELPHVRYYLHRKEFGMVNQKSGFIDDFKPYNWVSIFLWSVRYRSKTNVWEEFLSHTDDHTVALNKFYEEQVKNIPDSSYLSKIIKIHNTLNDEFEYDNDYSYYAGDDKRLERIDEYLDAKKLRHQSRFRIYNEMCSRIDKDFFKAYLFDKRICQYDPNKAFMMRGFDLYLCMPYMREPFYFKPKASRFGLEVNEFPFYHEGVNTMLIPQNVPEENYRQTFADNKISSLKAIELLSIQVPYSNINDNSRMINTRVKISIDSNIARCNAKVNLKGQFSTMNRGAYLYDYVDSTVNPIYGKRIYDIPAAKLQKKTLKNFERVFPYPANFDVSYLIKNPIRKEADGILSLNINEWFQHVIYKGFTSKNRQTSFYPDFLFQDTYRYFLTFDKPVSLLNENEFKVNLTNALGSYVINISQADATTIILESQLVENNPKVPAESAKDIEDVFSAIEKLNASSIKFKVLN